MSKRTKQLSNPFSTGGGGYRFEARVQASFVTLMVCGGFVPCLPSWPIKKIKLQGKYEGYDTDDAIVFVQSPDGKSGSRLLCQIKHSISISNAKTNKKFAEVIQAAWNDFNDGGVFRRGKDAIALITGPLSTTDITDVRFVLEEARDSENSGEFLRKVTQAKFSSKGKMKKLAAFREQLKKANGGDDVSDDIFWQFMKSFHLLGYDLDIKGGVTLSLVQTLIGQYSPETAHSLWTQIIDEVQSANQNAGTITIESLPEDIRNAFQKPGVERVPAKLGIEPSGPGVTNWSNAKLAIVNLLGGWDEKNRSDRRVVEKVANERYSGWISEIRGVLQQPESQLSLKNGTWTVVKRKELWETLGECLFDEHLDRFKKIVIDVLKEPDPRFELPPEERYAGSIYGKALKHSDALRKGLAESLALLGSQPEALKYCSLGKAESIAIISIREIFDDSDWILWGSLDRLLPTLAEAAPGEFLSAVENALNKKPCPFDELFSQEGNCITGANYMSGLLWTIEALAWDERYLVQATVVLGKLALRDPGGTWANRPANSLKTIFLPWLPQTIASVEKRRVAVQTLQKGCPTIAWRLLLDVLPSPGQMSMGSHRPVWRKTIPDDWKKGVTNKEYWDQISSYADLAVEAAKNDFARLNDLVSSLHNLPKPTLEKFLKHLDSGEIKDRPEDERTPLWAALVRYSTRRKRHCNTDRGLNSELLREIEMVAEGLAPRNPLNLYSRLFNENDHDLYEAGGDWDAQRKKLEESRQDAVREIFKHGGFRAVIDFAHNVKNARNVGYSFGVVAEDDQDCLVLPDLIESGNNKIDEFAGAFICGRYCSRGWEWVGRIDTGRWAKIQIGQFLSLLPFTEETWRHSERLLGEAEGEYWGRAKVNPFQSKGKLDYAVEKLLQHNRPKAGISCLCGMLHDKKPLDTNKAVNALLKAVTSDEPDYSCDIYEIIEIVQALQEAPNINQDDLFGIEWAYLPLLTGPGRSGSPRLLEERLACEPDFFCEVIRLLYRPRGQRKSTSEPTEQEKRIAENVWRLLEDWSTVPGKKSDGSFCESDFSSWLKSVKTQCEKSGHIEVALSTVGQVLVHYVPDPDGLSIHRGLAEALNAEDAEKMRDGFSIGIFNSRGVYCVDPTGKPEKDLAAKYRQQAEEVENAGYYRFAGTLRKLADSYEHEAERIVQEHEDW